MPFPNRQDSLAGNASQTYNYDGLTWGSIETAEAYLTGGVVYSRGDLLSVDPVTNIASLATPSSLATTHLVMPFSLTALQATAHNATGLYLAFYSQGEFNDALVTYAGVPLTQPQIDQAKASLVGTGIRLRRIN